MRQPARCRAQAPALFLAEVLPPVSAGYQQELVFHPAWRLVLWGGYRTAYRVVFQPVFRRVAGLWEEIGEVFGA